MSKSNEEMSSKLTAAGASMTPLALKDRAQEWFGKNRAAMTELMGGNSEARRMFLAVMNTISRNPKLLQCSHASIFKSLVQCAELRLYPGPMQEAALVPFWNSKSSTFECQFMPQYAGLAKLAYNAGFARSIRARVVWAADEFSYKCGTTEELHHVPFAGPEEERGERVGAYCVITLPSGDNQITYLNAQFIERTRKRSRAGDSRESPWNSTNPDDVDWMWKKTAIKQALKLMPKSAELAKALEADAEVEAPELKKPAIVDFGEEDVPNPKEKEGEKQE
jgi:recombination protein RecT